MSKGASLLAWASEHQLLTAFVTLAAAAIAPVTAYVSTTAQIQLETEKANGQLRLEQERQKHTIATEQRRQDHEIRMAYFSKAVDPALDDTDRERVLRFLASSFDDEKLRVWATDELATVRKSIADFERINREVQAERAKLQEALSNAKNTLAQKEAQERLVSMKRAMCVDQQVNCMVCTTRDDSDPVSVKLCRHYCAESSHCLTRDIVEAKLARKK
jgi:hypothetical protein